MKIWTLSGLVLVFVIQGCNPLKPSGSEIPGEFGGFLEPVADCSLDGFSKKGTWLQANWSLAPLVSNYRLYCETDEGRVEICAGPLRECSTSTLAPGKDTSCFLIGENRLGSKQCGSVQRFKTIGAFQDQLSFVVSSSQLTLTWTEALGAQTYKVEELDLVGGVTRVVNENATSPLLVSSLSPSTPYRFRVTAINSTNHRVIDSPIELTTADLGMLEIQQPSVLGGQALQIVYAVPSSFVGASLLLRSDTDVSFVDSGCALSPCLISNLAAGIAYTFKLRGETAEGTVIESPPVSGVPLGLPAAFSSMQQTSGTELSLQWGSVPGALSYQVEYGQDTLSQAQTTTQTSMTLSQLSSGLTQFRLKAINASGFLVSEVQAQTVIGGFSLSPLTFVDPNTLIVAWSNALNASAYEVFYGVGAATTKATCTSSPCVLTGMSAGLGTSVQVKAIGPAGGALLSDALVGTPLARPVLTLSSSTSSVTGNWTLAGDGATYLFELGTSAGTYTQSSATQTASGSFSGLSPSTFYYGRVRAQNAQGSLNSAEESVLTSGDTSLTLHAPTMTTLGALSFTFTHGAALTAAVVKYGTATGVYPTVSSCTSSPCVISGLTPGQTYHFILEGQDGNNQSYQSAEVLATPLEAPSVLTKVQSNGTSATINWSAVTGASSYSLRYGTNSQDLNQSAAFSGTSGTLHGLTPGNTLFFVVDAVSAIGSVPSVGSSLQMVGAVHLSPLTLTEAHSLRVSWSQALLASEYTLTYGTNADSLSITAGSCTTSPCTVTGLTAGTTYYFRVSASHPSGGVQHSSVQSGTPLSTPLLTLNAGADSLQAAWTGTVGANYTIKYGTVSNAYSTTLSSQTSPVTLSALAPGTNYFVVVESTNPQGTLQSSQASAMPTGDLTITLQEPSITSNNSLSFTFTKGNGIAGVSLVRGLSNASFPNGTSCSSSPCTVGSLSAGHTHFFRIVGVRLHGGDDVFSNVVSGVPIGTPAAFTSKQQTGLNSISLTWSPVSGASDYVIEHGTTTGVYSGSVNESGTSVTLNGLGASGVKYIRLRARSNLGSVPGPEQNVTMIAALSLNPITILGPNQLTLTWPLASGATNYSLSYGTASGVYTETPSCVSGGCLVSGLPGGVRVYFQLTATNSNGGRMVSAEESAVPLSQPVLTINPGVSSVVASWTSAGAGANYTLKYGTSNGTFDTLVSNNATSPITISGLTYGVDYYFSVEASNAYGMAVADQVLATPLGNTSVSLAPPSITSASSLNFTFNKGVDITTTALKYGLVSGTYDTTTSCNASPCNVSGLTAGTSYCFRLEGSDANGNTFISGEVAAVPLGPATTLTAPAQANVSTASLSWGAVAGATGYIVDYGTSAASYSISLAETTSTTASLSGLTPGTTYYIRVRAKNTFGDIASTEQIFSPIGSFSLSAITLNSAGDPVLSWGSALNATDYSVYYGTSSGSFPTATTCTTTPCVVTGLTAGTTYYFRATATNTQNGSMQSNEQVATPLTAPIVTLTGGNAEISVSWTGGLSGPTYSISYGLTSGNYSVTTPAFSNNPVVLNYLTPGTTYYVVVNASNANGTVRSIEQSSKAGGSNTLTLNAPSIQAVNQLDFSWTQGDGIESVVLKQGTVTGSYPITTSCTATPCTLSGLTAGTTYFYRLEALDYLGVAVQSAEQSGVPLGNVVLNSPVQSGLGVAGLSWSAVAGASSYTVSHGPSSGNFTTDQTPVTGTSDSVSGLSANQSRFIRLRASNASGSLVSAEREFSPVGAFTLSSVTLSAASQLVYTWTPSLGATSYTLRRGTSSGTFPVTTDCTTSPCTETGLTAGTDYFLQVTASNALGGSLEVVSKLVEIRV